METDIQYLRELAELQVFYHDQNDKQLAADPNEVQQIPPMWYSAVQTALPSYANSLAVVSWKEDKGQMLDELLAQLWQ